MIKILRSLIIFLILNGCAQKQISAPAKVDVHWSFIEDYDGVTKACLNEEDVKKLRETMIRCGSTP